jgi:hypothetical protein
MSTTNLLEHLLANRHRLMNQVIIDCLVLATLPLGGRRYTWEVLAELLYATSQPHLSKKLCQLKLANLIDYERGDKCSPGYLIRRVGPP